MKGNDDRDGDGLGDGAVISCSRHILRFLGIFIPLITVKRSVMLGRRDICRTVSCERGSKRKCRQNMFGVKNDSVALRGFERVVPKLVPQLEHSNVTRWN
jgi:hypothetical protein